MTRKTEDRRPRTEDRGPDTGYRSKPVVRHRSRVSGLRSLVRNTDGQALLETVIALPVLFIFMLVVMELSMMYNAKQLANYAAFCAARTAGVYGVDSTAKRHFAAAMAMSSIASGTNDNANSIMLAYGVTDPNQTMAALCSIPGFQSDSARWRGRLANAYLRTFLPECDTTGTPSGRRKHVTVRVTYIYRCSFVPFGIFWGQAGINAYCTALAAFFGGAPPLSVSGFANQLMADWRRNITIHGRAVTDYWAG